jgi:hypothetical protein
LSRGIAELPGGSVYRRRPGWSDRSSGSSSQLPVCVAAREVSCWSARSRVAARTNELDADERRLIVGSGEGSFRWLCDGWWSVFPGCVAGGVVSQAPIRRPAVQAGWTTMTMCPGTGLLSQKIERGLGGRGSCRRGERARGSGDRCGLCAGHRDVRRPRWRVSWWRVSRRPARRAGGRRGSAACGRSRWWRSSCRGAWRWWRRGRRTPGSAWRSGLPG